MKVELESKTNKFLITCGPEHNAIVMGMPDRRFRKGSRVWAAPALRRNIEYMRKNMNNPQMYSKEALAIYNKSFSDGTEARAGFPNWYKFKNEPMKHQINTMNKAFGLDEYAILFEQGLGKTYTTINLAAAWRMRGDIDAVVVVCPSSIKLVWEDELKEHCPIPTQPYALMAGKYKQADKFMEGEHEFPWLVMGVEALSQGGAHEYLERFLLSRRCLFVIDESSRIKTPNKTRTDRCIDYGMLAKKRLILSGTSVTQGIEDLYTQFKFLNKNIIGFDSFYTFRANYCITMQMEVARNRFTTKIIGYQNEDELIKSIGPYTSRVEKKDALDLPEKIFQNRLVEMNPKQKKLYSDMRDELFMEMGEQEYEVSTVLEQMLRLQQITGGFYPHDDGEKITPQPIPGKNPKITELMSLMDEIPGKIVIWCQFRCEIEAVAEALKKADIEAVQFHGGCDDLEKKYAVRSFRKDDKTKVFLATRAAAYGLTLTEASTAIYFSQGYSLEDYSQSQDRIHRIGQKDSCNYIHLACPRTVDIKVIQALRDKQSLATMVYDSMKAGEM